MHICWSTKIAKTRVLFFSCSHILFINTPKHSVSSDRPFIFEYRRSTVFSSARKLFRSSGQIAKDLASVITLSTTQHLSIGLPKGCNICFCPSATTCRINEIRCEKEVISKTARIDAFLPRLAKNMLANVRNTLNWLKLISLIDSYIWASVFIWRPWLFIGQFTI